MEIRIFSTSEVPRATVACALEVQPASIGPAQQVPGQPLAAGERIPGGDEKRILAPPKDGTGHVRETGRIGPNSDPVSGPVSS